MKILTLFVLLLPALLSANDYAPFKEVGRSGEFVQLTFSDAGVRYTVTLNDKKFISNYGQILEAKVGEELTLTEKHSRYVIKIESKNKLVVYNVFSWQGKKTEKTYEITIK